MRLFQFLRELGANVPAPRHLTPENAVDLLLSAVHDWLAHANGYPGSAPRVVIIRVREPQLRVNIQTAVESETTRRLLLERVRASAGGRPEALYVRYEVGRKEELVVEAASDDPKSLRLVTDHWEGCATARIGDTIRVGRGDKRPNNLTNHLQLPKDWADVSRDAFDLELDPAGWLVRMNPHALSKRLNDQDRIQVSRDRAVTVCIE